MTHRFARVILELSSLAGAESEPSWHRGWRAATRLRECIPVQVAEGGSAGFLEHLVDLDTIDVSNRVVDSFVLWRGGHRPLRGMAADRSRSMSTSSRWFRLARDYYFLLFDGNAQRDYVRVFSPRIAGLSAVASAFAAELLAPVEVVRTMLGPDPITLDDVRVISDQLNAPIDCVRHQIENHHLATISSIGD